MTKIELIHPEGKKAVSMDADKYELIAGAILGLLTDGTEISHNDLLIGVKDNFSKRQITFAGSVNWHLEWVKLDLEARGKIKRVTTPQTRYTLTNK